MLPLKKIPEILFVGLFVLTACSPTAPTVATPAPPQPTATAIKILPTPASSGDSITWQGLQVTMSKNEITEDFVTEFGTTRNPPPGMKFMWVDVQLKNVGQIEVDMPHLENFSVLYTATELKPTYGHRQGHQDYSTLAPTLFPNQAADAWLRFDIPDTAELKDLRFIFLPESSQVGTSFSSPNYPYSDDKPAYVWKCTP